MRINVYSQELTKEVKVTSKKAADTGIVYYGIRLYFHSPDLLHHTDEDDDRSAITFWIPHANSFTPADLAAVFRQMAKEVERVSGLIEPNDDVHQDQCGVECGGKDQQGEDIKSDPCLLKKGHSGGHSSTTSNWGEL